jgi:hypothetical protein
LQASIEAELNISPAISSSESSANVKEQSTPLSKKATLPPMIALSALKAIADGLSWLDTNKTLAAMTVCKYRTPSQVCHANFDRNAKRKYYQGRCSEAFKQAMLELSD